MPTSPRSNQLLEAARRIEDDTRLDAIASRVPDALRPLTSGPARPFLRGEWLGHALHPLLTDFPLGCWASAGLLDLIGGRSSQRAAQRLVGLGLLFVPATVASGAADLAATDDTRARRVGVVHAAGNMVVAGAYWRSWRARRRGHHLRGVMWGLVGGNLAWVTGYLGGHLSLVLGVGQGSRDGSTAPESAGGEIDLRDRVDRARAAALLDVVPEQIDALVAEGLLTPGADGSFAVAEVRAARLLGG